MPKKPQKSQNTKRSKTAVRAVNERKEKERVMTSQVTRAKHALFSSDKVGTENVKFFLGSERKVTAEQLAEQLNRADAQVLSGMATPSTHLDGDIATREII